MAKQRKTELHSFYCLNCGQKTYELMRPVGHRYGKFHRKALYCPWCRATVNCIECNSDEEVYTFKQAFEEGLFKEEAKTSLTFLENTSIWS